MIPKKLRILLLMIVSLTLASAVIAKAKKTKNAAAFTGSAAKLSILLLLNTSAGTQNTADGTVVLFDNAYSTAIADEDSYKFTNLDESIAINRGGTLLSIEGRPAIIARDTVPLKVWQYTKLDYLLRFEGSNFAPNVAAVLKDAYLNTETPVDLSVPSLYSFNVSGGGAATNRFSVIFYLLSVPAAITSPPGDATVCSSGNAVFNTTAAGFYLYYQWQLSTNGGGSFSNVTDGALYAGATTNSLSISGVPAAADTFKYRVIVSGSSPVSADTSAAATLHIANTWIGNSDNEYNNPANWACNTVPAAADNVIISGTASKMPQLTAAASVGSILLQNGSFVDLNGQSFTINGGISGAGTFAGSISSSLTISGTANINFATASNILKDLTVTSTANIALGTELNIAGVLNVAGTFELGNHTVTLKAGTEGGPNYPNTTTYPNTAIVAPVTGTITYGPAGKFMVERYIPAGTRAFRFISPSVNSPGSIKKNWMENGSNAAGYGTHITGYGGGSNGFDPTITNNPSLFTYNNATQAWGNVANTAGTLRAGDAYRVFVRGDRTIDLYNSNPPATATILRTSGILQTGSVIYGPPFLNGMTGSNRYNFVGNPYASPVRFSSLAKINIAPSYWAWDPNLGSRGIYVNYLYFTGGTGDFLEGFNSTFGVSKVNDTIQPGQAFFIQTTGAAPSLTFHEADKSFGTTPVFRTMSDISRFSVQLLLDTSSSSFKMADAALALFSPDFSAYVGSEDAAKFTNPDENLAIVNSDTALSIEGRPLVTTGDTVFIKLWQYRQKDYYLRTQAENSDPSITAILKDRYLNTETTLDPNGALFPFSINTDSASFGPDRFMILFKQSATLPVVVAELKAYAKDKGVQLEWINRSETNIVQYEVERSVDGYLFAEIGTVQAKGNNHTDQSYSWFDSRPLQGDNFYRIKVTDNSGEIYFTQIVKVSTGSTKGSITIFPNPVKGNTIHLEMDNVASGKYEVSLYSSSGQQVFAETMQHRIETPVENIKINPRLTKGTYRIQLKGNEAVLITTLIVQ